MEVSCVLGANKQSGSGPVVLTGAQPLSWREIKGSRDGFRVFLSLGVQGTEVSSVLGGNQQSGLGHAVMSSAQLLPAGK